MGREQRQWNTEQAACVEGLKNFFARVEKERPNAVAGLANLLGQVIGAGGKVSRDNISEKLSDGNLKLGLAIIGDLENDFEGKENQNGLAASLKLGLLESGKKKVGLVLARSKFQDVGTLEKIVLNRCVKLAEKAVRAGITPREIVRELLRDSVSGELTMEELGSNTLRKVLSEATNGHVEWIREVLGIKEKDILTESLGHAAKAVIQVLGKSPKQQESVKPEARATVPKTEEQKPQNEGGYEWVAFLEKMMRTSKEELMEVARKSYPDKEPEIALAKMYVDMVSKGVMERAWEVDPNLIKSDKEKQLLMFMKNVVQMEIDGSLENWLAEKRKISKRYSAYENNDKLLEQMCADMMAWAME